tara:strand:- start:608 stop:970 length:363 start_codon:yes stop_codon:yes gene_type:complete
MINIYGLKNCDSCRKAIKWLNDNNFTYEFFDFKKNPITKNKTKEWLKVHGIDKILNKKSTTWRQLDQNLKDNYESDALTILENFPTLIKRPFWEISSKALKSLEPGFRDEQMKLLKELKK